MNTSSHLIVAFSYQLHILSANVPCSRPLRLQLHRAPPPDRLVRELSKTSGSMTMRSRCRPTPAYWLPRGWPTLPILLGNTRNLGDFASPILRESKDLSALTKPPRISSLGHGTIARLSHLCASTDWTAPYLRLTRRIGAMNTQPTLSHDPQLVEKCSASYVARLNVIRQHRPFTFGDQTLAKWLHKCTAHGE